MWCVQLPDGSTIVSWRAGRVGPAGRRGDGIGRRAGVGHRLAAARGVERQAARRSQAVPAARARRARPTDAVDRRSTARRARRASAVHGWRTGRRSSPSAPISVPGSAHGSGCWNSPHQRLPLLHLRIRRVGAAFAAASNVSSVSITMKRRLPVRQISMLTIPADRMLSAISGQMRSMPTAIFGDQRRDRRAGRARGRTGGSCECSFRRACGRARRSRTPPRSRPPGARAPTGCRARRTRVPSARERSRRRRCSSPAVTSRASCRRRVLRARARRWWGTGSSATRRGATIIHTAAAPEPSAA